MECIKKLIINYQFFKQTLKNKMISNIIFLFLIIVIIHIMLIFPIYMSYYETQTVKENNIKKYKFSDNDIDPMIGEFYISKMMKIINLLKYNVKFVGFLEMKNILHRIYENENTKNVIIDDFFDDIEKYIECQKSMDMDDNDVYLYTMDYIKNKYINL